MPDEGGLELGPRLGLEEGPVPRYHAGVGRVPAAPEEEPEELPHLLAESRHRRIRHRREGPHPDLPWRWG
jgi:hypothetical protein